MNSKKDASYINRIISLFLTSLVITIPFNVSVVFAQEQEPNPSATLNEALVPYDPGKACIEKGKEAEGFIDVMDSSLIKTMEGVFSTGHAVCQGAAVYETVINPILTILGFLTDLSCKCGHWLCAIACAANDVTRFKDDKVLSKIEKYVCFYTECTACTEDKKEGKEESKEKESGGVEQTDGEKDRQESKTDSNKQGRKIDLTTFGGGILGPIGNIYGIETHISPYENIYVAVYCKCPGAILFNLRKLKAIYQTYNCCVQNACSDGITTESCDRQLSVASCVYWEGSIIRMMVKFIAGIIPNLVRGWVGDRIDEWISKHNWVKAIFLIKRGFDHIQALASALIWVGKVFKEPDCEALDFEDVKKSESFMQHNPYQKRIPNVNQKEGWPVSPTKTSMSGDAKVIQEIYYSEGRDETGIVTKEYGAGWNPSQITKETTRIYEGKLETNSIDVNNLPKDAPKVEMVRQYGTITSIKNEKGEEKKDEYRSEEKVKGQAAYEATWLLLDNLLSYVINPIIDKALCEQDWEDSYLDLRGKENVSSTGISSAVLTGICDNSNKTTVTAQLYKIRSDGMFNYTYSYTITACKEEVRYEVFMLGDELAKIELTSPSILPKGNAFQGSDYIKSALEFNRTCINVNDTDVGENCFPAVT